MLHHAPVRPQAHSAEETLLRLVFLKQHPKTLHQVRPSRQSHGTRNFCCAQHASMDSAGCIKREQVSRLTSQGVRWAAACAASSSRAPVQCADSRLHCRSPAQPALLDEAAAQPALLDEAPAQPALLDEALHSLACWPDSCLTCPALACRAHAGGPDQGQQCGRRCVRVGDGGW